MGSHQITNVTNLNGKVANDLVTGPASATNNNLCSFNLTTGKVIKDSGISTTSVTGGPFLPLAGGTMTGNLNMGVQNLTNVNSISTSSATVTIGNTNTNPSTNSICVGSNNTIPIPTGGISVLYGNGNNAGGSLNGQNILYGNGNTDNNSSGGSFIYGFSNSNGNGSRNTIIGRGNTIPNGVNDAIILGSLATNSTSNSVLFPNASSDIRTSSTTCNLGTTANPFQNLYLNGYALTSSLSNSIPATRCTLSNTTIGFTATTVETNIIQGTLSGSLVIPPPTAAGFTIKMFADWLYSTGAMTTFTIRLKINGTTALTTVIPAGAVTNQTLYVTNTIQLRTPSNRLFLACHIMRDLGTSLLGSTIIDSVWLPAGSNTISMTGQFSDTNGTWRGDSFELSSSYAS
jgi:hypothetical protein